MPVIIWPVGVKVSVLLIMFHGLWHLAPVAGVQHVDRGTLRVQLGHDGPFLGHTAHQGYGSQERHRREALPRPQC